MAFQECQSLVDDLKKFGLTESSLFKCLTADLTKELPEVPLQQVPVHPRICAIFHSGGLKNRFLNDVLMDEDVAQFYAENIACSDDEKEHIFKDTLGQSTNKNWFKARQYRVSASKARQLGFAKKDNTLLKYFFNAVMDNDNLRYGRETEPVAREEYSNSMSVEVLEPGLVVSRHYPWLCASPDGLIVQPDGQLVVLEIKCPVSGQSTEIEAKYIENGQLKKSHPYFAQVQIQLFACDAKVAHFYLYGQLNSQLIIIERDDQFC
jgi:putative phage-type endonuclease